MDNIILSLLEQSLIDQKNIFGDELYENMIIQRKTEIQSISKKEEKNLIKDNTLKVPNSFGEKKSGLNIGNDIPKEEWQLSDTLEILNDRICNCQKCQLGKYRNKFVFGSGNPEADVLVIGEGPGADEDAQGLPFVGRAGKLLTDILLAIQFTREEVYIANVVKCRPPGNRAPLNVEMAECMPYLLKQIDLIKPKVILCLGLTSAHGLLNKKDSLTNMRGKIFELGSAKVMVTYHPAALLRNPNWKRGCWEDVQQFRKLYDEIIKVNGKV